MKWLLIFWAVPMVLLFSWYGLSYYDINFGYLILSRDLHNLVFTLYGNMLGVDPEAVPALVLKAIIVDTALVFALVWLRVKRKTVGAVFRAAYARIRGRQVQDEAEPRESEASLSSAP